MDVERRAVADSDRIWDLLGDIDHWLAPADGGTLLALGIEWSGPLAGVVRALLGAKTRRMVALEAVTFVRLAERAAPRG